jgi:hypothetical protein
VQARAFLDCSWRDGSSNFGRSEGPRRQGSSEASLQTAEKTKQLASLPYVFFAPLRGASA